MVEDEEAEEGLSEGQVTQIQLARALCGAGLQSGATVGRAVQQLTNRNKPAESLGHMLMALPRCTDGAVCTDLSSCRQPPRSRRHGRETGCLPSGPSSMPSSVESKLLKPP